MQHFTRNLLTAVLIAATATACGESHSAPLDPGSPELATRTEQDNDRLAFSLPDVDNPCTPGVEAIDLEGVIHGQGSLWDNGHFKSHYDLNVTGADADGIRYQGVSTGNGKGEFLENEADAVMSTVINSLGGTANFVSKIVLHHHSDGTITVDRAGEACRGSN